MMARYGTLWIWLLLMVGPALAQNPYYDHGSFPAPGSTASSSAMRAELDLIEAGFAKLPTLSGNANKAVVVNSSGTALTATYGPIASGTAFPLSPSVNNVFFITNANAAGGCTPGAGSEVVLCRWDGATWAPIVGGETGWPSVNVAGGVTWANSSANAARFGNGTDYWALYRDPTDGLQFVGVCGGVLNDCNYVRKLNAGKYQEFQNSAGTSIGRLTESTGAWTNFTLDVEGTGNAVTLPFRWDLDLCGVSPTDGTTTGHVWNRDPLSTSPTPLAVVGTNRGTCKLTFPDSDGDYGVQISRQIPDGTLTGNFDADIWWDTTGTGNARFQIQTKCYADDEAGDAAFNTASVVTAAAGTSGRPNKQTITNITVTGCAGGELMRIRFFRNRTEASDTLNAALNVEKIVFKGRVIE